MTNPSNLFAQEERRRMGRAVRLLLRHPVITSRRLPDDFALVQRMRDPLVKWFEHHCGWTLTVDSRAGYARLAKVTVPDARRPLRRTRGSTAAPFDRRRYVLLCVAAAELLNHPVTTIGILAGQIEHACAVDAELPEFDVTEREQRRALSDVVYFLDDLGVVEIVDGNVAGFIDSVDSKALLRTDQAMLMSLLAAPQAPFKASQSLEANAATDDRIVALLAEPRYFIRDDDESDDGRARHNRHMRHRILRRLLDDPVVHYVSLTEDERSYLTTITGRRIIHDAAEQAAMVLEERAEGLMLLDPDKIATDISFPDSGGNAKQAALLLLDALTSSDSLSTDRLHAITADLLDQHSGWAKSHRNDGGVARLLDESLELLAAMGLVVRTATLVTALPAAHRYRLNGVDTLARSPA